jgi:heptosyltransferase I
MTLHFKPPLQHVCLLRLSAIGDTCHALAAFRAFQSAWPQTRFTWIIGKLEAKLMTAILPEIEPAAAEHVLDSFMGFARACGIDPAAPRWDLDLPADALDYARGIITDERPTLAVSPCSSHTARNWAAERYAAVADYAANVHHMRVVLVGGRSAIETQMGLSIASAAREPVVNQIGKDTLPQLLGLLSQSTVLLSPDSGPAHMATMVGLPVIGLYAATNPARAGPYYSRHWCVDKYDAAARKYLGKPAAKIPWTTKIERSGVMDLIRVSDVTAKLDALMAARVFR